MAEKISEIQQKILEYRQEKGYSIDKTIEELKITRKRFNQNVEKLKEKGLYNEQKIKEAMKNRRLNKEIDQKNFSTKLNLNPEEEEYRKKCIDIMCKKYFDYNKTKHFNPILVSRIQNLNKYAPYKIIYNTIVYQQKSLDYAYYKTFSSEFQKISYMIAIIKNNLSKVYKDMQEKEEQQKNITISDSLARELTKKRITKPTKRLDMTDLLDD